MNCTKCGSSEIYKNGHHGSFQKYACRSCGHFFIDRESTKEDALNNDNGSNSKKAASGHQPSEEELLNRLKKTLQKPKTLIDLCNELNKPPKDIETMINILKESKYNILQSDRGYEISTAFQPGGCIKIDISKFKDKQYRFGLTSDNHLNSKFERLDILNALYDIYEEEGITEVYNAGNWIDGYSKFNKYDVYNSGMTAQIEYFIKHYPQRPGITTYFVAGDDHEGWYAQREGINIGEYAQLKAELAGRTDLKYIGYLEADITLISEYGKSIMKIMHPGGGSAYALSYSPQKMIESFQGGEKPNILVLGHYHKADYLPYRNVHCVQTGCTQDQTPFMRKKKIQAMVGGWIVEFWQSKDGAINRFRSEWLHGFNKEYYRKNDYYLRA